MRFWGRLPLFDTPISKTYISNFWHFLAYLAHFGPVFPKDPFGSRRPSPGAPGPSGVVPQQFARAHPGSPSPHFSVAGHNYGSSIFWIFGSFGYFSENFLTPSTRPSRWTGYHRIPRWWYIHQLRNSRKWGRQKMSPKMETASTTALSR